MNKEQRKIVFIMFASLAVLLILVSINDITRVIASFLAIFYLVFIILVFGISNIRRGMIDKKITVYDINSKVDIHKAVNKYIKFSILKSDKNYGNFLNFLAYIREDKLETAKSFSKFLGPKYQFLKYYYLYIIAYSEKNITEQTKYFDDFNLVVSKLSKREKENYKVSIETIKVLKEGTLKKNPTYLRQFKDSKSRVFKRISKFN